MQAHLWGSSKGLQQEETLKNRLLGPGPQPRGIRWEAKVSRGAQAGRSQQNIEFERQHFVDKGNGLCKCVPCSWVKRQDVLVQVYKRDDILT